MPLKGVPNLQQEEGLRLRSQVMEAGTPVTELVAVDGQIVLLIDLVTAAAEEVAEVAEAEAVAAVVVAEEVVEAVDSEVIMGLVIIKILMGMAAEVGTTLQKVGETVAVVDSMMMSRAAEGEVEAEEGVEVVVDVVVVVVIKMGVHGVMAVEIAPGVARIQMMVNHKNQKKFMFL